MRYLLAFIVGGLAVGVADYVVYRLAMVRIGRGFQAIHGQTVADFRMLHGRLAERISQLEQDGTTVNLQRLERRLSKIEYRQEHDNASDR